MAQLTWEKQSASEPAKLKRGQRSERLKFMVGGVLILVAIAGLMISGTIAGARYFITVEEIQQNPTYIGQTVRIAGAVVGESIVYDSRTGDLTFTIAHIPAQSDDLAEALHLAANDASATRLTIHMTEQALPDLLQHEAQAILTGTLDSDGQFYASEVLLKCPSRFEEGMPVNIAPGNL